ncbi:MAG: hypothetical protein J7L23_05490 [Candidatus Diapherotrites archaeon]|nr:hypothetical protein [Candidatus Diapherotrites archaeon]
MHGVLIPLLSLKYLDKLFLLEATKNADFVVFLEVIDPDSRLTATELTNKINGLKERLDVAEYELRKRGVRVSLIEEWGAWEDKIKNVFKREGMTEVVVLHNCELQLKGVKLRRI